MPRNTSRVIRHRVARPSTGRGGSTPDTADYTISSALRLLESLDTPVSLGVAIQLRYSEWGDIVKRGLGSTLNPLDYRSAEDFRKDYLATCLLQKVDFVSIPGVDKKEVAMSKWRECELQCTITNYRLMKEGSMPEPVWCAIQRAKRKISSLLGEFSWDEAESQAAFGKGGTTRLPRRRACAANKTWGTLHVSSLYLNRASECFKDVFRLNREFTSWEAWGLTAPDEESIAPLKEGAPAHGLIAVDWNKVTTVPKSAKTDRTIASEPDVNIWIQKGIGRCIRQRLRRAGIDLSTQENNQHLAQIGSETGEWATIDLSSASDTVSERLVEMLIPDDWLEALAMTRSTHGLLPDGEKILYRKWSSMGNGYTFELETLIFWALTSAVLELNEAPVRRVVVYGDDIIMPSQYYGAVADVFTYCGFTVNQEKSFHTGPFRESCGKHYFLGEDVSPFYLKHRLDGPHRWFWWTNRIRHWCRREVAGFFYCDSAFRQFYQSTRAFFGGLVASSSGWPLSAYTVPLGVAEDSGFISNFDEANAFVRRPKPRDRFTPNYQGISFWMLLHKRKNKTIRAHPGAPTAWLFTGGESEEDHEHVSSIGIIPGEEPEPPRRVNDLPTDAWVFQRKRGGLWTWNDIGPWY